MTDATALKLLVEDASGQRTVVPVVLDAQQELLIGRGAECGLRLNERNVSRRHAKLALVDGAFVMVDLGAYNGVVVNGTRIEGQHPVKFGDGVRIGDFQLELRQSDSSGHEITKPTLLIGADEGTEPEGEQRALARKLAEEPTTPGATAQTAGPSAAAAGPTAQSAAAVGSPSAPVHIGEESTEILPRSEEAAKPAALTPPFAHFVCIIGEQAGRTYAIDRASVVIGRTQDNDIVIDHRSMSRHHVKIVVTQGRYRIVDLDSANGLLVNDEAYTDTELKHGDVAELGHVKLRFVAPAEPTVLTSEEREQVHQQRRPSKNSVVGRRAPIAAAVALGAGIVGSYLYLARAPESGPNSGVGAAAVQAGDRTEEEHLLMQARQAIALRNYPRAEALAGAVLELEPAREEARQILNQCLVEQKGHDQLEAAVAAAGRESWVQAYDALKEVPRASSASSRAATLMEQVRPALVAARVLAIKRGIQAEHFDEADRELAALEALQLSAAQVTELHDAIEAGKKARVSRTVEPVSSAAAAPAKGHDASRANHSSSDEPRGLYNDGLHALSQGHADRAVELLLRCVAQDKNYARCHRALGIAYAKMGNGPKAVRYYRQYLKVDPQAKDAASVKQLLQQYDSAQDRAASSWSGTPGQNVVPQAP